MAPLLVLVNANAGADGGDGFKPERDGQAQAIKCVLLRNLAATSCQDGQVITGCVRRN